MNDLLHSEDFGCSDTPKFICLHGLLGSSRNWRSVAKGLSDRFQVFALDLRNHGKSFHSHDASIAETSKDVLDWMDRMGVEQAVVCGHSLGGKVAMRLACSHPDRVRALIVADIAPRDYPQEHHSPTLDALLDLDLDSLSERKEAEESLSAKIPNWAFRQFLLTNLQFEDGKGRWLANLSVLRAQLSSISSNPLGQDDRFNKPTLFIRGGRSGYVRSEHFDSIRGHFPLAAIETVNDAGHDLHVENRPVFLNLVSDFLADKLDGKPTLSAKG